ncbi:MAG: hypothetical protein WBV85_11850 [Solirubrobacteraceae bacterium]
MKPAATIVVRIVIFGASPFKVISVCAKITQLGYYVQIRSGMWGAISRTKGGVIDRGL